MTNNSSLRAFTLVELSIVLVILGLLVGGVLSGQSLIRAAELRSITTEKDKYAVALHAFRDKYLALPGDMSNAFDFWGTDCGTDTNDLGTGCNGDGNGVIVIYNGGDFNSMEGLKVWEHLSRAGLIEGSFDGTGTADGDGFLAITPANSPTAKYQGGLWSIGDSACEGCGSGPLYNQKPLQVTIGTQDTGQWGGDELNWLYPLRGLTLTEAWNLDKKSDDGLSATGKTQSKNAQGCEDQPNDPYGIAANGGDTTDRCIMAFILE